MSSRMLAPPPRGSQCRRDFAKLPRDAAAPRWAGRELEPIEPQAAETDRFARDAATARLEAVLFCADEPLSLRRLASLADLADNAAARQGLDWLRTAYEAEGSAIQVVELAGGFQVLTRPEYYPWLTRLRQSSGDSKLTGSLLESLAIVAYRQPIMRADLEAIRGVHCGDSLRDLMERGLIRIAGRDDSLGRPMVYATTKKFLQMFGLRDLRDLPALEVGRNSPG